ncbi:c-type cytochrome [Oxalicibacterium faecigallinarum]|uniref:Cytochrome c n=1 Tax=Oxalicibacterium faecigallinarum TaxID=573741 RepID=A0A8J3AQ67_9BURK|nr:cytochrome c family protein [Oxalicibacterium faecigallinarum]GGI18158.1 cytochrome c [Oxalicibacterium faecigallinarum]
MNKAVPLALFFSLQLGLVCSSHAQTGNVDAGKKVFQNCVYCHQVGPSARNILGPHLNGIIGRPAGSVSNFAYSPAMKNSGIVWTEEKLRDFVRKPGKVVPSNKMRFFGLWSDTEADNLIAYLRTLK